MPTKKLKPNQPCHCGSGKKYKKCCMNVAETKHFDNDQPGTPEPSANCQSNGPPLRFKIGDKVLANINHKLLPGTVVDTHYREPDWPEGKYSPYQIKLDDGNALIHAPYDGDKVVQKYDRSKDESVEHRGGEKGRGKKQLRQAARIAEEELKASRKVKEDGFIPEEGNEATNQEEYLRSGMLEADLIPPNNDRISFVFRMAEWHDLRVPPGMDMDLTIALLEYLFTCLPVLRDENSMLEYYQVEFFMGEDIYQLLPSLLRMCVAPEQFVSKEDDNKHEPSEFVWDIVSLLTKLQAQGGLVLNGHMAKELASIIRVCTSRVVVDDCDDAMYLAYEKGGIDPLFDKGDESAFFAVLREILSTYPCRGHFAHLARRLIGGGPWADSHYVEALCMTIARALSDPTNCARTNAELFGAVLSMLRCPDLAEQVLPLTIDALRE